MMTKRRHGKRRHNETQEQQQEFVDDLAFAAQFAIMDPSHVTQHDDRSNLINREDSANSDNAASCNSKDSTDQQDLNEIDLDDSKESANDDTDKKADENDDSDSSLEQIEDKGKNEIDHDNDNNSNDDDDDDDESDVDLVEAMERMQEETVTNDRAASQPLRTEHELDSYRTPIAELEHHLQFQLMVAEDGLVLEEGTDNKGVASESKTSISAAPANLSLAGTLRNHMVQDRVVVVESSSDSSQPLDEGSLLVIKMPSSANGTMNEDQRLIPLGRVFEVFGPVTKPLYTIRLPPPPRGGNATAKEKKQPREIASTDKPVTVALEKVENISDSKKTEEEVRKMSADPTGQEVKREPKPVEDSSTKSPEDVQCDKTPECLEESLTTVKDTREPSKKGDEHMSSEHCVTSTTTETKENSAEDTLTGPSPRDPWAHNGKFTQLLNGKDLSHISVFCVKSEAKTIDTGFIIRISGKGCDASNMYDEEVINVNEMYFSDDEEERQAKSNRKHGKKATGDRSAGRRDRVRSHRPFQHAKNTHLRSPQVSQLQMPQQQQGFRHPGPPPPPPPPQYNYHPSHLHPPNPGTVHYQAPYGAHSIPNATATVGYNPGIPPPPPPPRQAHPCTNQGYAQPPPPPPPPSSNAGRPNVVPEGFYPPVAPGKNQQQNTFYYDYS